MKRRIVWNFGYLRETDPNVFYRDVWGSVVALVAGFGFVCFGLCFALDYFKILASGGVPLYLQVFWYVAKPSTFSQFLNFLHAQNLFGAWCLKLFLSSGAGLVVGVWLFVLSFKPRNRLTHIRGRRYLEGNEAIQQAKAETKKLLAQSGFRDEQGKVKSGIYLAPDLQLAREQEVQHLLISGQVGSGKSVILYQLLTQIYRRDDRALVVDWKGEFIERFDSPIFNPYDSRSLVWDIAKDLHTEADAYAFACQLIRDSKSGDNQIFVNGARVIAVAIMLKVMSQKKGAWGFSDLLNEIAQPFNVIQKTIQTYQPASQAMFQENSKTVQSFFSQLISDFKLIQILAKQEENKAALRFSIKDFVEARTTFKQIILGGNVNFEHASRAYISAIIDLFTAYLNSLKDSKNRKIWLIADEFPLLQKLEAVRRLITFGRSKGVRVVLVCQDFGQLSESFGKDGVNVLKSSVGLKIIAKTQGSASADLITKEIIGNRTVERRNVSIQGGGANVANASFSSQREEIPVVYPSELDSELGIDKTGIKALVVGHGSEYVLNLHWNFINLPSKREPFDPVVNILTPLNNPATKGVAGVMEGEFTEVKNIKKQETEIKQLQKTEPSANLPKESQALKQEVDEQAEEIAKETILDKAADEIPFLGDVVSGLGQIETVMTISDEIKGGKVEIKSVPLLITKNELEELEEER